ncbi:MAG: Gfo/Idh/MocA family oxidoreductase [Rhizobacter sp.]|nr:Gfo/Idh/MocA family oxidoreductase [Chlorobiales bacterium]
MARTPSATSRGTSPKSAARSSEKSSKKSSAKKSGPVASGGKKIRYAVVGLGHISQNAILPAFKHAKNAELAALISDDEKKLKKLGKLYGASHLFSYDEYDDCLKSGEIDAVFIALPNNLHRDYTVRAAAAGIHILCEKPLAVTEEECEAMIRAADKANVKLMTAYRLHFEEANLQAVKLASSGKLGEVRFFNSIFSMNVEEGNIRVKRETGGGTLYDIGIYCINAARMIFQDEPLEVSAATATKQGDGRFTEIEEMTSATLRFSNDRLATFTVSFGVSDISSYRIAGTKGDLTVEPAYGYQSALKHQMIIKGKKTQTNFKQRDQFAAELVYFSDCILNDKQPEPSGIEGLADVRIIRALYESADGGKPVKLGVFTKETRPTMQQEINLPPITEEPPLIHAEPPHR